MLEHHRLTSYMYIQLLLFMIINIVGQDAHHLNFESKANNSFLLV